MILITITVEFFDLAVCVPRNAAMTEIINYFILIADNHKALQEHLGE